MMSLSIKIDTAEVTRLMDKLRRESPVALAKALTFTAERVRDGLRDEMSRAFKDPTPYTLNSLRLKTATATTLTAEVKVKDEPGKGTAAIKYLQAQIYGGSRAQKRFERALQAGGYLPSGWVAVPGNAVKLDAHGNVPASVYVRVLSQLRLQRSGGFESRIGGRDFNREKTAKSAAKQGGRFFVGRPGGGKLPLGVWFRQPLSFGGLATSIVSPMFVFVPRASYRKRYKFFERGNALIARHLKAQVERQLSKLAGPF